MSNFSQAGPLCIRKLQASLDLSFQYPILSRQIFIAQDKFRVEGSSDIGQQARPVHSDPPTLKKMQLSRNLRPYQKMGKGNLRVKAGSCKLWFVNSFEFFGHTGYSVRPGDLAARDSWGVGSGKALDLNNRSKWFAGSEQPGL